MKNFVQHITVAYLVAIISISTMGISVNSLYCFCARESKASFLDIKHICNRKSSDRTMRLEDFRDLEPCRQKALKKATSSKSNQDYTNKTKKRIKIDVKFLEIKKTELPLFELFASAPCVHFTERPHIKV